MDKLTSYRETLKHAGMRLTGPREVICAYLAATDRHPTPYEVYADLATTHPEISRATVYNTLNTLQQLGAIVELSFGADHTHYDTNPEPHVNLICLRCHRISDYEDVAMLESLGARAAAAAGFCPLAARMDVLGVCAECHAAGSSAPFVHPRQVPS